ncbi:hypothetical protein AB0451_38300 [Streptomyces sp. NPDC052000]
MSTAEGAGNQEPRPRDLTKTPMAEVDLEPMQDYLRAFRKTAAG